MVNFNGFVQQAKTLPGSPSTVVQISGAAKKKAALKNYILQNLRPAKAQLHAAAENVISHEVGTAADELNKCIAKLERGALSPDKLKAVMLVLSRIDMAISNARVQPSIVDSLPLEERLKIRDNIKKLGELQPRLNGFRDELKKRITALNDQDFNKALSDSTGEIYNEILSSVR
jgi:hypothetical protein